MVRHRARLPPPPPMPAGLSQELTLATPGAIGWATRGVQPPTGQYVEQDDNLIVNFWSSINPTSFEVRGRLLGLDGLVRPLRVIVTVASGSVRQQQQFFQPLAPGFLLDLACFPSSGVVTTRGQVFVSIGLGKGPAAAPFGSRVLIQGYLENVIALQYPGTPILGFLDGAGLVRYVHGATPAVGTQSVETVPTGARWSIMQYAIILTTSAAAATRYPSLQVRSPGVIICDPVIQMGIGASSTIRNSWGPVRAFTQAALGSTLNCEQLLVQPYLANAGFQFVTQVYGMDVADQLSAPDYIVEEHLQP